MSLLTHGTNLHHDYTQSAIELSINNNMFVSRANQTRVDELFSMHAKCQRVSHGARWFWSFCPFENLFACLGVIRKFTALATKHDVSVIHVLQVVNTALSLSTRAPQMAS